MSGYLHFVSDRMAEGDLKQLSSRDVMTEMGKEWRSLPEGDKKVNLIARLVHECKH